MDLLPEALSAKCGQNRGLEAMISASVLLFIAISIVSLRIYIRAIVLHNTGYDDYLILISSVSINSLFTFVNYIFIPRKITSNCKGLWYSSVRPIC